MARFYYNLNDAEFSGEYYTEASIRKVRIYPATPALDAEYLEAGKSDREFFKKHGRYCSLQALKGFYNSENDAKLEWETFKDCKDKQEAYNVLMDYLNNCKYECNNDL